MASGLDATRPEGTAVADTERWKNGHVLTFWAYDYNYHGTTQYHVYHNSKTCCGSVKNGQRFTLSTYKQRQEDEQNGWIYSFTFWAYEDKFVDQFVGKKDIFVSQL